MVLALDRYADRDLAVANTDRRRGLRVKQFRPVKVFEPMSNRYVGGQTYDISATGLRIELPISAAIRPGKLINVHVGVSEQGSSLANRRQMVPARVVWIDRTINARKSLSAGIEFISSIAAHLDAA
jgi:hypothetical protein